MRKLMVAGVAVLLFAAAPAQARLRAPGLQSPRNHAHVQSLPAFTWGSVRGAATYEFEFSSDRSFSSGVSGFGQGAIQLSTTAITDDKAVQDGTYYWRVRGVSASDHPGPWSRARTLVKRWTASARLLSPLGSTVNWPSTPLLLKWSTVPYAVNYNVYIATDPSLSNLVIGSLSSPQQVQGPQFAFPTALAPGTYYWAIQPVDAEGDRGVRSAVSTFTWAWPSTTNVTEVNDSPDPSVVEPQFNWGPISGAASYEVEVSRATDFATGSLVVDQTGVVGHSYTPTQLLPNETNLYWRIRARDPNTDAGSWNVGQPFQESFDQGAPTIQNLQMVDEAGNVQPTGQPTANPILTWSPVPGASSYNVHVGTWSSGPGCDFSNSKTTNTPNNSWTPIGSAPSTQWEPPGWPGPNGGIVITASTGICVRVNAERDDSQLGGGGQVQSASTQIGNTGTPAFNYVLPTTNPGTLTGNSVGTGSYYMQPMTGGATQTSTPLFEWNAVPGASGYFIAIAYDPGFTNIVPGGVGYTGGTAWAAPMSLLDETNSYYWEIIPTDGSNNVLADPQNSSDNSPQAFTKSSIPPTPTTPTNGATVQTQPTFQWTSARGERNYTLEIASDPSFGNPIEQITTDATSYTANNTLPANKTLYWRVRANDLNGNGFNWSATETFTHHLLAPTPSSTNPTKGSAIPEWTWSPVSGATQYNFLALESGGNSQSFTLDTPFFTPTEFIGSGILHWQVQAVFPGGAVSSYSSAVPYVRTIPAPRGVHATKKGTRIVISWASDSVAKQYQVTLSTTNGFNNVVTSDTTDNTVWVPQINSSTAAMKLYWRIAAIDHGGAVGAYATGVFKAPRHKKHRRRHH